jgi:hypothetical protein
MHVGGPMRSSQAQAMFSLNIAFSLSALAVSGIVLMKGICVQRDFNSGSGGDNDLKKLAMTGDVLSDDMQLHDVYGNCDDDLNMDSMLSRVDGLKGETAVLLSELRDLNDVHEALVRNERALRNVNTDLLKEIDGLRKRHAGTEVVHL